MDDDVVMDAADDDDDDDDDDEIVLFDGAVICFVLFCFSSGHRLAAI